ncbi:hypothetical protein [Deinococcus sp. Leaf326]|uniref:hypothetical protein n=1 Tax=Deinococcus sp. Leaf326 TaxID=1736338 RepID=UPI0006F37B4C|nr:hypothetical protein [Deinococcus sp. Leaf326]KQR37759.1 hypothetical protein ASF71_14860 [Deinococcus sp. Leaf326]
MTPTEPTAPALALAAWWAGFLTRIAPQDNGDDSATGGLAAVLMVGLAAREYHTPEEAARFEAALARHFQAQLSRNGRCSAWTDYDPDTVLCAAATEAGIELSRHSLPIKSGSTGSEHTAEVKQGYRGDWRSIWTRAEGGTPCPR